MTLSKLLRWLKMKIAGRFLVRFSRPSTFTRTPLAATGLRKGGREELTPRRWAERHQTPSDRPGSRGHQGADAQ